MPLQTLRRPEAGEILAHEAVHRAQFARWPAGPTGSRVQLEAEAQAGSAALLAGRHFRPDLSAPPGLELFWTPEDYECTATPGECMCSPDALSCHDGDAPAFARPAAHRGLIAAPGALTGIRPYLLVDIDQLPGAHVPSEYIFEIGPYLLAPHATLTSPPLALYYVAYRKDRKRNEWVVGPDSIATFEQNWPLYEGAGNAAHPGSAHLPSSMPAQPSEHRSNWHTGQSAGWLISARDSHIRVRDYADPAASMARSMIDDLDAGRVEHRSARREAMQARNDLLSQTRSRMSPGARALSETIKEQGLTSDELILKNARRLAEERGLRAGTPGYDRALRELGESPEVSRAIIEGAGRTNKWVTRVARVSRVAGPIGAAAGLGISSYEVVNAEEGRHLHVAARELGGFAGGTLGAVGGGLIGAWTASLICGPGAPVCALVVSVVVVGASGYAGGLAGEMAGEGLADKLGLLPLAMPAHSLSAGGGFQRFIDQDHEAFRRMTEPLHLTVRREMRTVELELDRVESAIAGAKTAEKLQELQRTRLQLIMRHAELLTVYQAQTTSDNSIPQNGQAP